VKTEKRDTEALQKKKVLKKNTKCDFCTGYEEKIEGDQNSEICKEIADMKKHELIACIASYLGKDPEYLSVAEELFEILKYPVTEYVLKHEFNKNNNLSLHLALWLEEQSTPDAVEPLNNIVDTYLKSVK